MSFAVITYIAYRGQSYPSVVEFRLNPDIIPLLLVLCPQDLELRWFQRAKHTLALEVTKSNKDISLGRRQITDLSASAASANNQVSMQSAQQQ